MTGVEMSSAAFSVLLVGLLLVGLLYYGREGK